jgi:Fe(3+) dicitrate transport protein
MNYCWAFILAIVINIQNSSAEVSDLSVFGMIPFVAESNPNSKILIHVADSKNMPLGYATVQLEGTSKGGYTDPDGQIVLNDIKSGVHIIKISSIGYTTLRKEVELNGSEIVEFSFILEENFYAMPEITIIGQKERLFARTPGAVSYLDQHQMNLLKPISGNEILRWVPGLHVVDEEGVGMRINIGIRGLDPDRSRSVLMLEDGIPVALAPYGEPEMYYTPTIDRMQGVEVLKGSGQILYGPQTIGGVINYITSNPPDETEGQIRIRGGQNGYFSGLLNFGTSFNNSGFTAQYLRKQADNLGATKFMINDFTTKFKVQLSEISTIGIKLGVYDEESNSTYIGITQTMYDDGGQDFTRMAPDDRLNVQRYSASLIHDHRFNENLKLTTTAFGYNTSRNWQRQDFSTGGSPPANATGVVWGDTNVPGGYIYMRNGTGNRNRQFQVAGIEPRLSYDYQIGRIGNNLQAGVRYIHEVANEQRVNGKKHNASSGDLVEDEIRTGNAFSMYFQNKFFLSEKFSAHAGLRFENFDYERDIRRRNFGSGVRDTVLIASSNVRELIPGIGFNYTVTSDMVLFGGVHKGFAPPRVKDAISSMGLPIELDAEKSTNYELGIRMYPVRGLYFEMTGFYLDFANQIIPVSESSGGTGSGLVNGGQTLHKGIESAISLDLGKIMDLRYGLSIQSNATYTHARFAADRFLLQGIERINILGNRTPYAPTWLLNNSLTIESPFGLSLIMTSNYAGEQYTDELNTIAPSSDGRIGKINSYMVLDATTQYKIPVKSMKMAVNVSMKNLTNERYIVTRRPQGIRVGIPRFITAGIDIGF